MKPNEIAFRVYVEKQAAMPDEGLLAEWIEQLCDLVGADEAKRLIDEAPNDESIHPYMM